MNILLTNPQSLASKINEVRSVMLVEKPDLGFFTETWLRETISDNQICISGYTFVGKSRSADIHGGVGLYIEDSIRFGTLDNLSHPDFEALWVWLRPKRLPRGFPCLVVGSVYHPHLGVNDSGMLDYLTTTLTTIEGQFPGCGIFVCGDFNRMNLNCFITQFKLKQIVDKPTRGDKILDLVLTNLSHLYDKDAVNILPPFGLSDHNVVLVRPKQRQPREGPSRKVFIRRDTRPSRKAELGRYFSTIDWSTLDSASTSEEKSTLLCDTIALGLDTIMPPVRSTVHNNDPLWITPEFKSLIAKRQRAFHSGDEVGYRHLRNLVNRDRKVLRGKYFESKVQHLKETKPFQWWGAVKRIAGMTPTSDSVLHDLKWNTHICECIKKANTRLYFLVQLKRARVPIEDIVNFYCTTIRSVMEYASQVYHHALPAYLSDDFERVQRRAMRIIFPGVSYEISLERCGLSTLSARRAVLCDRLFDTLSLPSHKLNYMLPEKHNATYNTRHKRTFILPRMHTDRYRKSFIPAMCSRVNKGGK